MAGRLGADLEGLTNLSGQIRSTTGEIARVQAQTSAAARNVVEAVTSQARTALSDVTARLGELRTSVAASVRAGDATDWVGQNAVVFRGAASDFDVAMQAAEAATQDAFSKFQLSIQQMADALSEYQASFEAALVNAQGSTDSMAQAVDTQRVNLDETMNRGLSVG